MNYEKEFRYNGKKDVVLKKIPTDAPEDSQDKASIKEAIQHNIDKLSEKQAMLYSQNKYGVLIIFQAMDAAGKDGMIKHVMSGINPQGCTVHSFKTPTKEELDHDYLWRVHSKVPARGEIGIFNRSYYEDVLITKVHPEILLSEPLPHITSISDINESFWKKRYKDIRQFEEYLTANGYLVLKFFLHLSKDEQKNRFISRIEEKEKNWKFSEDDIKERAYWEDYQAAYEAAITQTATKKNPWYIIPSDYKWYSRLIVSNIIVTRMADLPLAYPEVSAQTKKKLQKVLEKLEQE